MQSTRRELLDQVLAFVGEPDDPVARGIAEALLNRAVEKIYMRQTWAQFVSSHPYELATVAGQGSYALPSYFGRVSGKDGTIRNVTTGERVYPIDLETLQERFPEQGTSLEVAGTPQVYAIGGSVGVAMQPPLADAQSLEIVSDSALDVNVLVEIEGILGTTVVPGSGPYLQMSGLLTGLAPVLLGALNGWVSSTMHFIQAFSKSYPAGIAPPTPGCSSVGTVTLRVNGQPTIVLASLRPDESSREYVQLVLYPKPATAGLIAIPIYRQPLTLFRDADPLPAHWTNAIVEEMVIQWRCNTGELTLDTANAAARPALDDLICWDNLARVRPVTRPFTG